jgi:hypothetical protein
VLTFYIVLFGAGSQDIFAQHLDASITTVDRIFRILLFVAPVLTGALAWKWCRDLAQVSPRVMPESDPHKPTDDGKQEHESPARVSRVRRAVRALEKIGTVIIVVGAEIAGAVGQRSKDHRR